MRLNLDSSILYEGIAVPFSELYGEGQGPVMLERVNCAKHHMQRLSECQRSDPRPGITSQYCTHSMDAGVICRGNMCTQ